MPFGNAPSSQRQKGEQLDCAGCSPRNCTKANEWMLPTQLIYTHKNVWVGGWSGFSRDASSAGLRPHPKLLMQTFACAPHMQRLWVGAYAPYPNVR